MKSIISLMIMGVLHSIFAEAHERSLDLFEIGKTKNKPAFHQTTQYTEEAGGITKSVSTMYDSQGMVVMTELARFKNSQIIEQSVVNNQNGESYELRLDKQHVSFKISVRKENGTVETKNESEEIKADQVFLSGPTAEPFLVSHWDDLYAKDRSLHVRFGIMERAETVGFKFSRHKIFQENGKEIMVVRMRPTSPFLALLLDPSDLYFDVATKRLVHYRGRTPLAKLANGKMRPFDSEIEYHYQ